MPNKAKPTSVTLDVTLLTNKVEAITALDAQLNKAKGTMAEVLKRGEAEAGSFSFSPMVALFSGTMVAGDTLADTITQLELQLSTLKQVREEFTKAWISANVSTAEVDALKAQREALVTDAEAVQKVLVQLGVTEAAEVKLPEAPKVRTTTGGGSTPAAKGLSFYYVKGSEKVYKAGSQNTLSSLAFYAPVKASVAELKDALKASGWDGTLTTTQEYMVTLPKNDKAEERTVTVGWTVHEADKAPEAPAAE